MYFCKFEAYFIKMKKNFLTIIAIAALILSSCSNKVDLYNYDGDTTVVYAMLDTSLDTNFFKITHSFIGDVSQLSQSYEANNYNYDEIEVTFSGVFEGNNQPQTFTLDTVSKWKPYDGNSQFYSGCRQTYYYTTQKLKEGEEYSLNVLRKEDNVNVFAKAVTINNFTYQKPISTIPITFTDVTTSTANVEWKVPTFPFRSTAAYFEVTGYFHYKELLPGAQDTIRQSIKWGMGSGKEETLYNTSSSLPYYVISYTPSVLFTLLANDEHLQNNSPGAQRWFEKFEFDVTAIGEDLYNYYLATNSTSAIQDVPNYSNVENGMGIMSARVTKSIFLTIRDNTRAKIIERFPEYGFIVN